MKYKHDLYITNYNCMPELFDQLYGTQGKYFEFVCGFNILHEIFHSLCREYSNRYSNGNDIALNLMEEELLANKFSISFWKLFGTTEFMEQIFNIIQQQKERNEKLIDDIDIISTDYKSYFRKNSYLICGQLAFSLNSKYQNEYYNYF